MWVNSLIHLQLHAPPVVACSSTCRKKTSSRRRPPVEKGHHKARLLRRRGTSPWTAIGKQGGAMRTGSLGSSSFTGLVRRRQAVRRRFEAALAASGALASMAFIFAVVAFVQARPNVPTLSGDSEFDGERSFTDLKRLVSFGPRPSGSRALEQSRDFIAGELHAAGATVVLESFTASTPLGAIPM